MTHFNYFWFTIWQTCSCYFLFNERSVTKVIISSFQEIKFFLGQNFDPSLITVDFESQLLKSKKIYFSNSILILWCFHLKRAIYRKLLRMCHKNSAQFFSKDRDLLTIIPGEKFILILHFFKWIFLDVDESKRNYKYFYSTWILRYDATKWNISDYF